MTSTEPARSPATVPCPCCRGENSFVRPRHGYARCRACGLLRNEPFPTVGEIVRHYEKRATGGNYDLATMAAFDRFRRAVYRKAFARLGRHRPGGWRDCNVLDVGCFTGLSLEVIQEQGATAFGVELQEDAARIAAGKSPGRVFSADICRKLPFPEKFAAITLTDVIEHLHDPLLALRTLGGSLEEDGLLLITTPNTQSLAATLLGKSWPSLCPIHHLYLFNPANLRLLLDHAGLELIECSTLWKTYSLEYVVRILPTLSPGLGRICRHLPRFLQKLVLPLNGGEMLALARNRGGAVKAPPAAGPPGPGATA